jgi:hypothetical protein
MTAPEGPAKVGRCSKRVPVPGMGFHDAQCRNKAGYGPYLDLCKIHSPDGIEKRKKLVSDRWEIKRQRNPYTRLASAQEEIAKLTRKVDLCGRMAVLFRKMMKKMNPSGEPGGYAVADFEAYREMADILAEYGREGI